MDSVSHVVCQYQSLRAVTERRGGNGLIVLPIAHSLPEDDKSSGSVSGY